jgi:hypothetical protein
MVPAVNNALGNVYLRHYCYYYYYYYVVVVVVVVSCHRPFLPGTSLEPTAIPTALASSFRLKYFPYYV